ncbi:MAG: spermidine/putrescine ABC transporter substrate-binding protein [Cyanobacteria bacterium P01_C01_bin.89]
MAGGSYSRRAFLQQTAAAAMGLSLSSCGWRLANVRPTNTASADTSKLYIFTWAGYTDKALLEQFTAETGVSVVVDIYDSNEAMLAKLQSGGGGAYSIVYPSDYMVRRMRDLDLLQELDRDRISGLDSLFEPYQDPSYDPNNRHSVPVSWGTTGLVYNRKSLGTEPQDWDFLWDQREKLTRRMTLMNDTRETMGASLRRLGFSYNAEDPEAIRKAFEALQELKPFLANFTTDAWRDRIVAGDLSVAMGYSVDAVGVESENPDLGYVIPASGASLWTDTMAIPVTAPNPDAAHAWIDFMLRPDVAASVTKSLSFATPSRDAFELLPPDISENPSLFPPDDVLAKCEGLAPVGASTALYERYWNQLTSG